MTITEVPVLPFRAGRHLAAWIVWHTARVSWLEDDGPDSAGRAPAAGRRRRRSRA
jgi:hypothetical protein